MSPRIQLAVTAVMATVTLAGCSSRSAAESTQTTDSRPPVAVERAARADLSHTLTLTAEFTPYQEVDVMAKVAGYIKEINVDIGDHVHAGQVIAILEVPEMADDLTKAAASVQLSDAEVVRASDELAHAKAAHEVAHLAYHRLLDVSKTKPGLVAQQELDDSNLGRAIESQGLATAQPGKPCGGISVPHPL
jgi:multidrug efflux pump subunit AcrA (membrane-fusion protein)